MKVLICSHSPDMKIFQHLHKHVSIQVWIYLNHAFPSTCRRPLLQYVTPVVRLPPTMCCLFVAEKQYANHTSPLYPASTYDLSAPPLMGLCEDCMFKQFLLSFDYSPKTEKHDSITSRAYQQLRTSIHWGFVELVQDFLGRQTSVGSHPGK